MINNPYRFSLVDPMSHINSIISSVFTVYDQSMIHFVGKVEYLKEHWMKLMDHCSWFDRYYDRNKTFDYMAMKN